MESLVNELEELDRTTHIRHYTMTVEGYDSVFVVDQTFDITARSGTVGGVLRSFRKLRGHRKPPLMLMDQILRGKTEIEHMGVSVSFEGDADTEELIKFMYRLNKLPDEFVIAYAKASLHG